jgi:ssDNA-specific exonuclease RecJ
MVTAVAKFIGRAEQFNQRHHISRLTRNNFDKRLSISFVQRIEQLGFVNRQGGFVNVRVGAGSRTPLTSKTSGT